MKKFLLTGSILTVFIILISLVVFGCIEKKKAELTMEYLYAEGCDEYCPPMTEIINDIEDDFPEDRLEIRYINLTERHTRPEIMKIQIDYKDSGKIKGVPAYAINGEHFYTGMLSKEALIDWICQYFEEPKPDACN